MLKAARQNPHLIAQVVLTTSQRPMDRTVNRLIAEGYGGDVLAVEANLNIMHREEILERDEIFLPVGKAKTSFIEVRDIDAVGARVLTETGHENKAYDLTGGAALDYYQVADLFTEVLGRKVTYRNPSALRFVRAWRATGLPLKFVLRMAFLTTSTRFGMAVRVTQDVEQLLDRRPITMRQYITDYAAAWLPTNGHVAQ